MISEPIYKRDSAGKIRTWQYEVDGAAYRTIAGIEGGKLVTSGWTECEPKNVGKKNETTPEQQALAEAVAEEKKKLKREYRKTVPELEFVPNGPMLAETYGKHKFSLDFETGIFAQPKLDGIRAFMNIKHGATTREFQPHPNCTHLMARLVPLFAKYPDIIFDGELYNHDYKDAFNELSGIIRREKITEEDRKKVHSIVQFHVYDLPSERPFAERTAQLKQMLTELNDPMIVYVDTVRVQDQDHLDSLNAQFICDGYEGQMVRLGHEPYYFDSRPWALMKRKDKFVTEEFPVKRIEEGTGNWAGVAKRVVLDIPTAPRGEVGAGMRGSKEFAREMMTKVKAGQTPKLATIRHFGVTPDGSLRHAVAVDFFDEERMD